MSPSSTVPEFADARLISAKCAEIIVGNRLRKVLPDRVATLQISFEEKGHLTPIDLVEVEGGMRLIYGAHRLAARIASGADDIRAVLHPKGTFGSETEILLREIAENFDRFELTALERAANVAALRDIHLAENGPAKRGPKAKQSPDEAMDEMSAKLALNFPEVVQRTLKLSRRDVFRALKVASIALELREQLAAHPIADNQSELLALAAETPARQAKMVALLVADQAKVTSVAEAIAIIDRLPPPVVLRPYERLSEGFSRLRIEERDRFFEIHSDDIDRWLAARGK